MISEIETKIHGIRKEFEMPYNVSCKENVERVLRNNIIDSIRTSIVTSDGNSVCEVYYPVRIIGTSKERILQAVNRYQELRREFLEKGYKGLETYDGLMSDATIHADKAGLISLPWIGGHKK